MFDRYISLWLDGEPIGQRRRLTGVSHWVRAEVAGAGGGSGDVEAGNASAAYDQHLDAVAVAGVG